MLSVLIKMIDLHPSQFFIPVIYCKGDIGSERQIINRLEAGGKPDGCSLVIATVILIEK